ncbi:MAG: tetratricopeptide repeat protein [Acidobacteria bacterium]|nr:tetratricopeptide repeat protein [Acidobacteriota bacterium]
MPWFWPAAIGSARAADDPDALYADRERIASALLAADIWERRLAADPNDFEAAWKLGRAGYWVGGHVDRDKRRAQYERGMAAARRAILLQPDRPEGHFWLAADMGAMAESFGLIAGIRYRGPVKRELEIVLRIDPAFQQGSADRALGRWYDKVPSLFGGSNAKAVEHLQRSLTYDPESAASHYFLAEVLLDMKRKGEARAELEKVIDAPLHPEWIPEVNEFKARARARLAALD